jgi:DNA-binding SARP family transcriptional activator
MLRIYLAGEPCLWGGGHLVRAKRLPGRQGRLALVYLVAERSRPVPRAELVEALWPRRLPAAYDVALSALVSKLRLLGHEVGLARDALTSAAGCYKLALPAGAWVDTEAALQAVHDAEAAMGDERPQDAYGPAVVAAAILRRPLLPGAEGTWVDARREALLQARVRALDVLAEIHSLNWEPALAIRAAEERIALEPFRESGYRHLMRIHHRAGDRAEALRVYERCRRLLEDELGEPPGSETELARVEVANDTMRR